MAQQATHVPKFGNWNSDEHIPYTTVFDHARAGKGASGRISNPNDPEENSAAFQQITQKNSHEVQQLSKNFDPHEGSIAAIPPRIRSYSELDSAYATKNRHERGTSREDGEFKCHVGSPARYQYVEASARRAVGGLPGHQYTSRGTSPVRSLVLNGMDSQRQGPNASRESSMSEHSVGEHQYQSRDWPPGHSHYQGRVGNKSLTSSPASRRKLSADGVAMFSPATPGRSKLRGGNTRADETPDRGAPLPKFGAWNENDPASAESFTVIFNKAREEKQTGGAAKIPTMASEMFSHERGLNQANGSPQKSLIWCCCAPRTID